MPLKMDRPKERWHHKLRVVICRISFFGMFLLALFHPGYTSWADNAKSVVSGVLSLMLLNAESPGPVVIDGPWTTLPPDAGPGLSIDKEQGALTLKSDMTRMAFILEPDPQKEAFANTVYELGTYEGRLYLGYGDHYNNQGPVDIVSYDPLSGELSREMVNIPEERVGGWHNGADNLFYGAGKDAMESWTFGSFYVNDGLGWKKRRTVPDGVHVAKIVSFQGRLYAQLFGVRSRVAYPFALVSEDTGLTWSYERIDPDETDYYYEEATYASVVHKTSEFLYAYVFLIATDTNATIRRLYRFNGSAWEQIRIFYPSGELIPSGILAFQTHLLVKGFVHNPATNRFESTVYALDGQIRTEVGFFRQKVFSWSHCCINDGRLYCMTKDDPHLPDLSSPTLHRTWNLTAWETVGPVTLLPGAVPKSIMFSHDRLYVGATNGPGWWNRGDHMESWPTRVYPIENGTLQWAADIPEGAQVAIKMRTALTNYDLENLPWIGPDGTGNTAFTVSGTSLPPQCNGDIYFQASISKTPNTLNESPLIRWLTLDTGAGPVSMAVDQGQGLYTAANAADSADVAYVSSLYDLGETNPIKDGRLFFEGAAPGQTTLRFQVRSALTRNLIKDRPFVGPDGSQAAYYQTSGQSLWEGHNNHLFIQYKSLLASTAPTEAPHLRKVVLVVRTDRLARFSIDWKDSVTWQVGEKRRVSVTAQSPDGTRVPVNGKISLSAKELEGGETLSIEPAEVTLSNGIGAVDILLKRACPTRICASLADVETCTQGMDVIPGRAAVFSVTTDLTSPQPGWSPVGQVGAPFSLSLAVLDRYGNTATGYTGKVKCERWQAESTGQLCLPYTFLPSDLGFHQFTLVTVQETGEWSLVCYDTTAKGVAGAQTVNIQE